MLKNWIIGENGIIISGISGSWRPEKSETNTTLRSICLDRQNTTLWIVGHGGTILSKSILSQYWTIIPSNTNTHLLDVFMFSPVFGYIIGENGLLLKTTNGRDWTKIETNTSSWLRTVYFVDENHGWIGGNDGILLSTQDGSTWIRQDIATTEWITKINFIDNNIGWLCGTGGLIRKTIDGGQSWITSYNENVDTVQRDSHGNQFIVTQTNIKSLQCYDISLSDIIPINATTAMVAANDGQIYKTQASSAEWDAGGVNWAPIEIKTVWQDKISTDSLKAIAIQGNNGVAVGSGGLIAISKDGGTTWQKEPIMLTEENLYSVCIVEV
jgi:photosystem II stability/assembly factor-like uncharacterized protein